MGENSILYDLLKIVILGDSGVGKSNIISRYNGDLFVLGSISTIGVEFYTKKILIGDKNIMIQLWDTAGQERFRCITSNYYKGCDGILLVYDITDQYSFENITGWLNEISFNTNYSIPILLIGNKSDLESNRIINTDQANELANKFNIKFIEMSARTNTNITPGINNFIEQIYYCNEKNIKNIDKIQKFELNKYLNFKQSKCC